MPMTCHCPTCGSLLSLPTEHLGKRVVCPKCSAEFSADRPSAGTVLPVPEAIEPPGQHDPLARSELSDDRLYVTEHPRQRRSYQEEEDEDHPEARFLDRGLPGRGRAIALIVLLGVSMIVDVAGLGVDCLEYGIIEDAIQGKQPNQAQATFYDSLEVGISLVDVLIYIATVVVFCVWTYRAYKNLPLLGVRGLQYSPGWAVGYFFIPILNLFKPCIVFREMWKASDPEAPIDDPFAWEHRSGGFRVGLWWASWIIAGLIGNASFRANLASVHANLHELQIQTVVTGLARAASFLAAMLAIFVVKGIQDREAETYRRLLEAETAHIKDRFTDEV